jgi:hypothetical protein
MEAIPQLQPENPKRQQENSRLNLHRFYQHLRRAGKVLEGHRRRGVPHHIGAVFGTVLLGLQCAEDAIRLVTHGSSRNG